MPRSSLFFILLIITSCGGLNFLGEKKSKNDRMVASVTFDQLLHEENQSFSDEIDSKLLSLHSYYVIGHKNLLAFDSQIKDLTLEELYESSSYLSLIAVRTQTDEIENELKSLVSSSLKKEFSGKNKILLERIEVFKKRSYLSEISMMNLTMDSPLKNVTSSDLEKETKILEGSKEFMIYEKNIEHLSHLMEIDLKSNNRKFKPSENTMGNLTGQEFPAKVWALTFDNGPDPKTSMLILKNLQEKKMKATFFQLTQKAQQHLKMSQSIRDAGMEIGSHSYSHKELTKIGGITLEKEITLATETLEKDLKIDVKLFRLPFGSGVSVPTIRRTIARNNLIHVFWNVDSLDWMAQTTDKIVERTKKLMAKTPRDAGVILFHDTHLRSALASSEIMDHLNKNGRRNCTLGKIIKEMNEDAKTVCSKM